MRIKLIFLNIRELMRHKPFLFLFIIVSQIICIMAAFTVAGMMDAVTKPPEVKDERSDWDRSFCLDFAVYSTMEDKNTQYDNKQVLVVDRMENKIVYYGTNPNPKEIAQYEGDDSPEESRYALELCSLPSNRNTMPRYRDVKEKISRVIQKIGHHYVGMKMTGFTNDSLMLHYSALSGTNRKDTPDDIRDNLTALKEHGIRIYSGSPVSVITPSIGDKLTLGQTEYTVREVKRTKDSAWTSADLLTEDADEDFIVCFLMFMVDDTLVGNELGEVSDMIQKEFQGMTSSFDNPKPKPLMEKQFNNMIYVVSFILMAVMLLNLSRLYTYIFAKRKNAMAVYALCGGSKVRIFDICLSEILLTLVFSYLCGFLLFRFAVMEWIGTIYPSFLTFFDGRICAMILGAYILSGGVMMGLNLLPMIRKSADHIRKEGGL